MLTREPGRTYRDVGCIMFIWLWQLIKTTTAVAELYSSKKM
jgi:hypothetical protein